VQRQRDGLCAIQMACESMYMNQNHPSTAMLGATY